VRLGLEALYQSNPALDVVLMMLGDQPYINTADIRQIIEKFKVMKNGEFLLPMVDGKRGNPVLLSGKGLRDIIEHSPEMTVRQYMDMYPEKVSIWESSNEHFIFDIDTPQDIMDFQNKTGLSIELPLSR
jgi:CTP:molybdopterin cytidylyltransferase MocA